MYFLFLREEKLVLVVIDEATLLTDASSVLLTNNRLVEGVGVSLGVPLRVRDIPSLLTATPAKFQSLSLFPSLLDSNTEPGCHLFSSCCFSVVLTS